MVRSLPSSHPTPPWRRLDAKRIAGSTLAICVHAAALGMLMFPSSWQPPAQERRPQAVPVLFEPVEEREIPVTVPPPQPIERPVERPSNVQPVTVDTRQPVSDDVPVFDQGEIEAPPAVDTGTGAISFDPGPTAVSSLAYDVAPAPRYPRRSAMAGQEGLVVLRVLVDPSGQPVEVTIETSSGHRELDRAAQMQVLERWRFHPTQRAGRAVSAWALVPIEFRLP